MKKLKSFCLDWPFATMMFLGLVFGGFCMATAHLAFLPKLALLLGTFLLALLFLRGQFHFELQTRGRANADQFFAAHPRTNRLLDLIFAPFVWWERHCVTKWIVRVLLVACLIMTIRWVYIIKIAIPRDAASFAAEQRKKGEDMARDWPARKAAILAVMRQKVEERKLREAGLKNAR